MSDINGLNVLVTGAGGCIGAWVVRRLIERGATPTVYDLSEDRSRLALITTPDDCESVEWVCGDISDYEQLVTTVRLKKIDAIIHLAALQVPFCKADPVLGAQVNVVGTVNILEVARQTGIGRITYASSIAAPAMDDTNDWLATLYGAYKTCNEQSAAVYWQDWQVPSVGIRPAIIYGPGRDQGMSAAPTIAMLAASSGIPYTVPFSGDVSFVYVEDAADCFIEAIAAERRGAPVFDLNGTAHSVKFVIDQVRIHFPDAELGVSGAPMPFPAEADDGGLLSFLGLPSYRPMEQGITQTLEEFALARQHGTLTTELALELVRKNQ